MKWVLAALLCGVMAQAEGAVPGWEPHVGAQLPSDLTFIDENGQRVQLGDYLRGGPTVLVLSYFSCRGLCPETFRGVSEALSGMASLPAEKYRVIAVSIDPRDDAADAFMRKRQFLQNIARAPQTHFLTDATNHAAVLARAVGFGFRYDAALNQYAHPAGIVVVDGAGRIRQYLYGVRFDAAALRAALITDKPEAPQAASASPLLLLCFHYDPRTGRYSLAIMRILQLGGVITVMLLGVGLWRHRRRM